VSHGERESRGDRTVHGVAAASEDRCSDLRSEERVAHNAFALESLGRGSGPYRVGQEKRRQNAAER
jgi:hypothetical protein